MQIPRSGGILLHPSSLPGRLGVGSLGVTALRFIDFLDKAGQKFWQILPLGPPGFGDSPYQCFSSAAGNPMLIDLELLVNENLLTATDLASASLNSDGPVDFNTLIPAKTRMLKKAYESFIRRNSHPLLKGFDAFERSNEDWLTNFALFMALKDHFNGKPWYEWEKNLKARDKITLDRYRGLLRSEIEFHKFTQFLFFKQWTAVKDHAHLKNIRIIGDIPLYVAYDSADVWENTRYFQLNDDLEPVAVGGVPPDYFSETGQLWGNPLYDWNAIRQDGFRWWILRIKRNLELYDLIRIDHFRGLSAYWSIPFGDLTAENGKWIKCPGKELFETLAGNLGELPIIAEDLGVITPDVEELRDMFGFPGMKILQFAFDTSEENDHLPYNYIRNSLVYTGTHDNNTIVGWFESATEADRQMLLDYLGSDKNGISWKMIRLAFSTVSNLAIIPMQDLLGLDSKARMNLPGTTSGNWKWRAKSADFSNDLAEKLARITKIYGRC